MSYAASPPSGRAGPGPALSGDRRLRRRRLLNRVMEVSASIAALIAVAVLAIVIISVVSKGIGAINLEFLTKNAPVLEQSGGGIANAIVGTAILVALASLMAVPVGILIGIHTSEFAGARLAGSVRFALDLLNGVPTIVTGIFVFGLLIVGKAQSGWAGAFALAIIMLPIVARSAHEVLALVPKAMKESALALGVSHWKMVLRIVVPTAASGMITGALLGVARVAGETAPLLFTTSIFANGVSTNPAGALASIPVKIFSLTEESSPSAHSQAWGAALLLIFFILVLNVLARAIYARSSRRGRRAQ